MSSLQHINGKRRTVIQQPSGQLVDNIEYGNSIRTSLYEKDEGINVGLPVSVGCQQHYVGHSVVGQVVVSASRNLGHGKWMLDLSRRTAVEFRRLHHHYAVHLSGSVHHHEADADGALYIQNAINRHVYRCLALLDRPEFGRYVEIRFSPPIREL